MKDRRHENPGAPSLLSDEELLRLAQLVRNYAEGKVWDGRKVVAWLRQELDKEVYLSRAYEYFAATGFSFQTPRPAHVKAERTEQERFKKRPYLKPLS